MWIEFVILSGGFLLLCTVRERSTVWSWQCKRCKGKQSQPLLKNEAKSSICTDRKHGFFKSSTVVHLLSSLGADGLLTRLCGATKTFAERRPQLWRGRGISCLICWFLAWIFSIWGSGSSWRSNTRPFSAWEIAGFSELSAWLPQSALFSLAPSLPFPAG